jgi:Na+-driven multidrug efflux pump
VSPEQPVPDIPPSSGNGVTSPAGNQSSLQQQQQQLSNTATSDLGTEIFLSSLSENLATKEILDDGTTVDSLLSSPSAKVTTAASTSSAVLAMDNVSVPDTTTTFLEAGGGDDNNFIVTTVNTATTKSRPNPVVEADTQDTVNAILAASSQAVEWAEESLSQEAVVFEGDVQNNVTDRVALPLSRSSSSYSSESSSLSSSFMEVKDLPEILPASDVVGDKPADKIETPSVGKILKFAVPAVGVWLCSPLLSLIDTSSVGLLSGTIQQAALNPAVAVTDYAALLIAFLYTATTNMIAEARETDRGLDGKMPRTTRTFVGAMQFSTFVGLGLGTVLYVFAKPLLRAIIGNDGISPAVFAAAMKYVKIRALGMPAAAVIGSAQAACLGMQDIRSPLYVLLAAAVVNFMGDMMFVGSSHPWIGGAAGAAWATVFSQYAAVSLFVYWLINKAKDDGKARVVDLSKAILELTGQPTRAGKSRRKKFIESVQNLRLTKPKKEPLTTSLDMPKAVVEKTPVKEVKQQQKSFSARGFLKGSFQPLDLLKPPRSDIIKDFSPYILPVTSTQVGRVSGYVAMSHVVSSALGTASMAAQQVIVSLFYCLCPIADSLSLTAQSFVPSVAGKKTSKKRSKALRNIVNNFAKAGAVFGSVMVAAVACIPFLSRFFTADAHVVSLVNSVAPLLVGFFAVHGVLCAFEGVLLGRKDLGFLGKSYAAYFLVVPYFMLRVKRAALAGTQIVNLRSVWTVFLGYQLSRVTAWTLRLLMLQRRTERETAGMSS